MKLVIYPKSPKTNGNGRLPVKIFTIDGKEHDYSIDPRKVRSVEVIASLKYNKYFMVIEYDTKAQNFDLYEKSARFAEELLRQLHIKCRPIITIKSTRYKVYVDNNGLKFEKLPNVKLDPDEEWLKYE